MHGRTFGGTTLVVAALVAAGILTGAGQLPHAAAAGPTIGGIGCTSGPSFSDIQFPTSGSTMTGTTQLPMGSVTTLSLGDLSRIVQCGAAFQDLTGSTAATDANPASIDGGTIVYTLTGADSAASPVAMLVESRSSTYGVACGSASAPLVAAAVPATNAVFRLDLSPKLQFLGDSFTLAYGGDVTAPIAVPAAAASVAAALNRLASVAAAGSVTVAGGPAPSAPLTITFGTPGAGTPIIVTTPSGEYAYITVVTPGSDAVPASFTSAGGLESCQGTSAGPTGMVGPNPANSVSVVLTPAGISAGVSQVNLYATYTRFASLTASGVAEGPSSYTTVKITIPIVP